MGRMDGKVVLVTGGAMGIGRAICERLSEEGAQVAVLDIDADAGQSVAAEIRQNGGTAKFWNLNVADRASVEAVFKEIVDVYGGIDVLVNNAGISGADKPPHEITEEEWERVMDINVKGVFLCTRYAVPYMQKRGGGSIINMSSIYGIIGAPDIPPYHASKGAVREMTKTDAMWYAEDGIRVNSVHPGYIWTPLVEELAERSDQTVEEFRDTLDSLHPIGNVGEPMDIANGVLFLASDESKFMTGSEFVMDGGYTAQ